jgi:WD40 repeat protein
VASGCDLLIEETGVTVFVRDIFTGKLLHEFSLGLNEFPTAVLISPDKRRLLVATGTRVAIWDLKAGKLQQAFDIPQATYAAFTSDATRLVTVGAGTDSRIRVWHLPTGLELLSVPNLLTRTVYSFALSPDNRRIALFGQRESATSNIVCVLDSTPLKENP